MKRELFEVFGQREVVGLDLDFHLFSLMELFYDVNLIRELFFFEFSDIDSVNFLAH
jgi:hypothetical protein